MESPQPSHKGSAVSLRPFNGVGTLPRMRSRSLLQNVEESSSSSGASSSAYHSNLETVPPSPLSPRTTSSTFVTPLCATHSDYDIDTESSGQSVATTSPPSTPPSATGFAALPSQLSYFKLPNLVRKQSYLALSIPSTPQLELKGEDEELRLPSPVLEENEGSSEQLAARPIAVSTATLLAQTELSPHQAKLSTLLPPILFLGVLFVGCLICIYFLISTIPLNLPHNVSEITKQTIALRDYARQGMTQGLHVLAVLSTLFVFKQAFSVPGSILVNILFGSLYGTYLATLFACVFTGVGSVLAYYMAKVCTPLVERFFAAPLARTRKTLLSKASNPGDLFSYLLLIRLFPLLPYSALNMICGVLNISVSPFFWTLVLGSLPYNFVTTQLGDLLGNLAATSGESGDLANNVNSIWTWDLCFKLAFASVLSAAPVLFKEQIRRFLSRKTTTDAASLSTNIELSAVETEKLQALQNRPSLYDNIPLLRRDRTDSTASEVLVEPSTSDTSHKRNSSWSWQGAWDSLSSPSCQTHECRTSSEDSGYETSSLSAASRRLSSNSLMDEESGDTDEEIQRERRFSRTKNQYNSQRRVASIETSSAAAGVHSLHRNDTRHSPL